MKRISILLLVLTFGFIGRAQTNNEAMEQKIKDVALKVEKAAAERNVPELGKYLHKDYRVMANRFKGSAGTTILTREMYLEMMKSGKIGGTSYSTEFLAISISKHTAMVELLFTTNESSNMHKYLLLVQDDNDAWKIISDLPVVE